MRRLGWAIGVVASVGLGPFLYLGVRLAGLLATGPCRPLDPVPIRAARRLP